MHRQSLLLLASAVRCLRLICALFSASMFAAAAGAVETRTICNQTASSAAYSGTFPTWFDGTAQIYGWDYLLNSGSLGRISTDESALDSILNIAGSYGSSSGQFSIFNGAGNWGSAVSVTSACNSSASYLYVPEIIWNGQVVGYLTTNSFITGAVNPVTMVSALLAQRNATTQAPLPVTARLAAGTTHTAALKADGSLWMWGANVYGQLGDGSSTDSLVPKQIGSGYAAVAAGNAHTVALKSDGSLWAWGVNNLGQLGDGSTNYSPVPKQIGGGYTAIAAGYFHTLALRSDGGLWAWGDNGVGQLGDGSITNSLVPKQIDTGYKAIAAGAGHTIALKSDGSLWAWGFNQAGGVGDGSTIERHVPKQIGTGYTAIAAGQFHSVALKSDGSLWTWGFNFNGQLGDGTTTDGLTPRQIGTGYIAIAAGEGYTLALKFDGGLWAWGTDGFGVPGTTNDSLVPRQIGSGYTAIAEGGYHAVAFKSDGSLWAWGLNANGQVGDGTKVNIHMPKQIATGFTASDATAPGVPAGLSATAADAGTVNLSWTASTDNVGVAWYKVYRNSTLVGSPSVANYSDSGLLASSAYSYAVAACDAAWNCSAPSAPAAAMTTAAVADTTAPSVPAGLAARAAGVTQISLSWPAAADAADVSAYKVYRNGALVGSAGAANYPNYRDGGLTAATAYTYSVAACDAAGNCSAQSSAVSATTGAAIQVTPRIAAGLFHSVALRSDGSLWAWGNGRNGELGDGSTNDSPVPRQIDAGYKAIAVGFNHTVALKSDGSLWTWGYGGNGQLGDGSSSFRGILPKSIGTGYSAIAAGANHTVTLKTDGSLWTWGSNSNGQLGDGSTTDSLVPKQIGTSHYTAIAAGAYHTLALKSDGSLWAWGLNFSGQLGDGTTTDSHVPKQIGGNYKAISAGSGFHTVAIASDDGLWAWGFNAVGQLGDGTIIDSHLPKQIGSGYAAIAVGPSHTLALRADGSLWAWGSNTVGQLGDGSLNNSLVPEQVGTGYSAIAAGGHSLALKPDGTLWVNGFNNFGQLGDGTLANRLTAVLVINETADGPLDLIPEVANNIPPDKIPPFFVIASGRISDTSATVSTTTKFNPPDVGKQGAVFVTAVVPQGATLTALAASQSTLSARSVSRATARAASAPTPLTLVQLTASGWQPVVSGQLIAYASGVLGDQLAAQNILNDTDTTSLKGAQFCVGYGASAADMIAAGTMRSVATIALDPDAAVSGTTSCVVAGGSTTTATTTTTTEVSTTTSTTTSTTASTTTTTLVGGGTVALNLSAGWNLVGNSSSATLNVASAFADPANVTTVWKWLTSTVGWAFYAPSLADGGAAYAASKGYDFLTAINGGEGFWVNAKSAFAVQLPAGTAISTAAFLSMPSGWNLIAIGESKTPSEFNAGLGFNVTTLWAWDNPQSNWYFYAPSLAAQGGTALSGYIAGKGYLDFTANNKTLGKGTGFWVNRP